MGNEHAHDGIRQFHRVGGRHDDSRVTRKIPVPRDAAKGKPIPHALCNRCPGQDLNGLKADVIRVLEGGYHSAAVERHIEFAREAVKPPVVENMMMPCARVRARIEKLLRINPRSRRTGDACLDKPFENLGSGLGSDLTDLQIGARGDMGVTAGKSLRDFGDGRKLPVRQDAIGNAHSAHIAVLGRRNVEQPVIAPAEIVLRLRIDACNCLGAKPCISIEWMFRALPFFLIGKFATIGDSIILRLEMRLVWPFMAN